MLCDGGECGECGCNDCPIGHCYVDAKDAYSDVKSILDDYIEYKSIERENKLRRILR